MAKALLGDGSSPKIWLDGRSERLPEQAPLADSGDPLDSHTWLPLVTIRRRVPSGFSEDGNPMFGWADVVTGRAMVWEMRDELDDIAGMTVVIGRLTMRRLPDGPAVLEKDTAEIDGVRWRATRAASLPDRYELELVKVDDVGTG